MLEISTQTKGPGNWIEPGRRIMDRAWMRDKENTLYTGEALMLACLLHAKGKTKRGSEEMEQIARMLNDPNLRKEK